MNINPITVQTIVKAPISKVWDGWNNPEHIVRWAFASDEWEAPAAENDLRTGGRFKTVMAAKDKSTSFDFEGVYSAVEEFKLIEYDMSDGRHVKIEFSEAAEGVKVVETFDPENENSEELQRSGWQAILDNFRKYVESTLVNDTTN
ncbi:SRPBCC domain-containing protein [Candidatus Woesebacteria bacterium]|nr:SRPBCC domain-containing protein [Candidatus Woesebacteria bacterium]